MMYQLKNELKTLVTNNFVGKRCLVVEVQNFADVYVSITRLFTDFKGLYFTLYFMLIFAKVMSTSCRRREKIVAICRQEKTMPTTALVLTRI